MHINRRELFTVAGATLFLAACGSDSSGGPTTTASTTAAPTTVAETTTSVAATAGPGTTAGDVLSFTDDRGETVTFTERPTRVVAWQAMIPALVELGIEPVGVIAFNDLATNPGFIDAGVDTASLVAVSEDYGEVDIEALLGLRPDVILTYTFGNELLQGFTDAATQQLAADVAPFVALDANADVESGIGRMVEFAALMGADLEAPGIAEDTAAFDAAKAELQALVQDRPGLRVAFGGPAPTGLFVAPIDSYPELQFYRSLGLDVVDGPEDAVVSWELAPSVDADVFMIDDRTTEAELAQAQDVAVWAKIPAVAAGQAIIGWRFLLSYSRADYARTMQRLLATLRTAKDDVVA